MGTPRGVCRNPKSAGSPAGRASPETAWQRVAGVPASASRWTFRGELCGEAGGVAVLVTEAPDSVPCAGRRGALCGQRLSPHGGRGDAVSSPPPCRWGTWVASGPVHTAGRWWSWFTGSVGRQLVGLVVSPCCGHLGWPRVLAPHELLLRFHLPSHPLTQSWPLSAFFFTARCYM